LQQCLHIFGPMCTLNIQRVSQNTSEVNSLSWNLNVVTY